MATTTTTPNTVTPITEKPLNFTDTAILGSGRVQVRQSQCEEHLRLRVFV
jgi:hypothetical protein